MIRTPVTDVRLTPAHLTGLVQHFQVCWEVWPEWAFVRHDRRQVGFTIELSGTHEAGVEHPAPGCSHCQRVYDALHEIAAHVLPREVRSSIYDVASYDHAIHYSPIRGDRPDICLTIGIFHRGNLDDPVGQCQERCLTDMKQRLRDLGARERQWKSRTEVQR